MRAHRHPFAGDESGSLIVAMLGAIIVAGLIVVITSSSMNAVTNARRDRDRSDTVHAADIGIESALRRLNDATTEACELTGSCTAVSGTVGDTSYTYTMTRVHEAQWEVRSQATRNNVTRTIEAVLERPSLFGLAAFATSTQSDAMGLDGGATVNAYNHSGNVTVGGGEVGSNGTVRVTSTTSASLVQLHGPNATCATACPRRQGFNDAYDPARELATIASQRASICGGVETSWRASTNIADASLLGSLLSAAQLSAIGSQPVAILTPSALGAYCFTDVIFDVPTLVVRLPDVSGALQPVVAYVSGSVTVDLPNHWGVNCLPSVCTTSGLASGALIQPDAAALQLYMDGPGATVRIGDHNHLAAAIYAPNATCGSLSPSNHVDIYGSVVCATVNQKGNWRLWWDDNLAAVVDGDFVIAEWREEVGGTTSQNSSSPSLSPAPSP